MLYTEIYSLAGGFESGGWRGKAWEERAGSGTRQSISFSKQAVFLNSRGPFGHMLVRMSQVSTLALSYIFYCLFIKFFGEYDI